MPMSRFRFKDSCTAKNVRSAILLLLLFIWIYGTIRMAFFVLPLGDESLTDEEFTGYVLQAMNSPATWYEGVKEQEKGADARSYPSYLVILKSSRVGSTFLKETIRKEFPGHIHTHWEGEITDARQHFEKCEALCRGSMEVHHGKCACSVHLNDMFRDKARFDAMNDMVRDFNASVVFQIRANAIEKGISMSKRWGLMKEKQYHRKYSETAIAQDIKKYAIGTLKITRAMVHADDKNLLALPSHTQDKALWVWYEDLMKSCKEKFAQVFEEIGMGHLPVPVACNTTRFRDEGPYKEEWVRVFSNVSALVPMIDHYKYNMDVDPDAVYEGFAKETAQNSGPIFGVW